MSKNFFFEKILNILDKGIATAIICRKQLSDAIKTIKEEED